MQAGSTSTHGTAPALRGGASPNAHEAFVIPSLDGLRAVSFMIVFLAHAGATGIPGGFGVTVFFFLSGFLITTLLRLEVQASARVDFSHFYLRRVFRILPPFYVVLALAYGIVFVRGLWHEIDSASALSQVLHYSNYWIATHGWGGIAPGTGVYWSLAVEEHFYLVFPALYALLVRSGMSAHSQRNVLWALCACGLLWRFVLVLVMHSGTDRTYLTTDGRFDSMLFGCALAVYGNPALDLARQDRPSVRDAILLALGLLAAFVIRNDVFRETLRYSIQGLCLHPVFVAAIRYPNWLPFRFLNLRPVRYLGLLSYSMYLLHQVVIMAIAAIGPMGQWPLALASLLVTFALASLMYRLVEKPFARVRKKLAARPAVPVQGALA